MTVVQKILARATGRATVAVGDIVEPQVDLAMSHENSALVMNQFAEIYRGTGLTPRADERGAAIVLVERTFAVPVEFGAVQAQEDAGAWCLEQHGVRFLRSYFALDRQRMLCLYAAPDAEAVRHVQRQVDLPHDRVWRAQVWQSRQ
jgi:hypothetical protein